MWVFRENAQILDFTRRKSLDIGNRELLIFPNEVVAWPQICTTGSITPRIPDIHVQHSCHRWYTDICGRIFLTKPLEGAPVLTDMYCFCSGACGGSRFWAGLSDLAGQGIRTHTPTRPLLRRTPPPASIAWRWLAELGAAGQVRSRATSSRAAGVPWNQRK
jgi:hypothetical protein